MNRNETLALKKIAGCLVLVLALHYVLDQPHRTPLVQWALSYLNRVVLLPINRTVDHALLLIKSKMPQQLDSSTGPFAALTRGPRRLPHDPSFERWFGSPDQQLLEAWSSSLSIAPWDVVKKETGIVQDGQTAVRMFCDGAGHCGNVRQEIPPHFLAWLRNHRLRFSLWTRSTTPGAPCLRIDDEIAPSSVCPPHPVGAWELLTVEHTVPRNATRIVLIADIPRAVETMEPMVYVDNASVTLSHLPTQPPGAIALTAPPRSSSTERP